MLAAAGALVVGVAAAAFAAEAIVSENEFALVLRPADHQGAGLDVGDPDLLLHRRPRGRVVGARARRRSSPATSKLARTALYVGAAADLVSPALLISDLGRPERFLHMLRVFKVTSPMNVGSLGAARQRRRVDDRGAAASWPDGSGRVRTAAAIVSALRGPPLATYTGVLSRTRPCPSGTRPGASCRGSSARARPRARAPRPRCSPARGTQARRGGSRSRASSPRAR